MRTRSAVVLLPWLLAALLAGCRDEAPPAPAAPIAAAPPAQACALKVGWDPWEPYQYQDGDGSMRGLDIDIVSMLARDAGCELTWERGEWHQMLGALRAGGIGVLLAATPTPERQEFARFSAPYRRESFALYVRQADLGALRDKDLAALVADGRRIGVTEGYVYGPAVSDLLYGDSARTFVNAPIVEVNYARLLDGSIDALLDDPFVGASVLRRKGWNDRLAQHPQVFSHGEVSLMFSKSTVSEDVVRRFDEALRRRQADGTLGALTGKYQAAS